MLNRLPDELLRLVLEHLAPLDYHPARYEARRRDLKSCCLVNRTFRALAQPMLLEVVAVTSKKSGEGVGVEVDGRTRGSSIKLLALCGMADTRPLNLRIRIKPVVDVCPSVAELRLHGVGEFGLDWLAGMSGLRHLVVSKSTLSFSSMPTFPTLVELSLCDTHIPADLFSLFPSPSSTPNLRAFGLAYPIPDDNTVEEFLQGLSKELLNSLEVISLDAGDDAASLRARMASFPSLILDASPPFCDNDLPSLSACKPATLRFFTSYNLSTVIRDSPDEDYAAAEAIEGVSTLCSCLPSFPTTKLLILPSFLQPANLANDAVLSAVRQLLAAVEKAGIEVVLEDQAEWDFESLISPAFWRRRREERARTAGDAVEV